MKIFQNQKANYNELLFIKHVNDSNYNSTSKSRVRTFKKDSPSGLGSMWKLFSDFVFSEYYGISDLHKPG